MAPLSHFPPDHAGSEPKVRHHCFCALGQAPPGTRWRTAWSAGQFSRWGPPTGIARERETSADDAAPYRREWRAPCSIRTALFAALRAAVPAGGRSSRASRIIPPVGSTWFARLRRAVPAPTGRTGRALHSHVPGLPVAVATRVRAVRFGAVRGFRAPARCRSETGAWLWRVVMRFAAVRLVGGGVVGAGFALPRDAWRSVVGCGFRAHARCRSETGAPFPRGSSRGGVLPSAQKQWQRTPFAARVTGGKV